MAGIRNSSFLIISTSIIIIITSNVNARPNVRHYRSWNGNVDLNMIPDIDNTRFKFHDDAALSKEHRRVKKNMNNIELTVPSTTETQETSSGVQEERSNSEKMNDSTHSKSENSLKDQHEKNEARNNNAEPDVDSTTGIKTSNNRDSKLSSVDDEMKTSSDKSSTSESDISVRNEISKDENDKSEPINNVNGETPVKGKHFSDNKMKNVDTSVPKTEQLGDSQGISQEKLSRDSEMNLENSVAKQENVDDNMKDKFTDNSHSSSNSRTSGSSEVETKGQDDSTSSKKQSQQTVEDKMIDSETDKLNVKEPSTDSDDQVQTVSENMEKLRNLDDMNRNDKGTSSISRSSSTSTNTENNSDDGGSENSSTTNDSNGSRQPRMRPLQDTDEAEMEEKEGWHVKVSSHDKDEVSTQNDSDESNNGATHNMYPIDLSNRENGVNVIGSEHEDETERRYVDRQGKYLEHPPPEMQPRSQDIHHQQLCVVPCSPVNYKLGTAAQVVSPGLPPIHSIGSGVVGNPFISVPLSNPHIASALGAGISQGVSAGLQLPHGISADLLAAILSGHIGYPYPHHGHGPSEHIIAELPPLHFPNSAAILTQPTYLDFTYSSPFKVKHDSVIYKPPLGTIPQAIEVHSPPGTILHEHKPSSLPLQIHYHPHLNNY